MGNNDIDKKKRLIKPVFILLFAIIEGFLVTSESSSAVLFAIGVFLLSFVWDKKLAVAVFVCISFLRVELGTAGNVLCMAAVAIIMVPNLFNVNLGGLKKYLNAIVLFSIAVVFSFFFALDSAIISVALFIFRLFFMLYIAKIVSVEKHELIIFSIVAVGIAMLAMVWLFPQTVGSYSYRDNQKDLSTVLGIAVYFVLGALISKDIKGFVPRTASIVLLLFLVVTTVFTYARGVLLAMVVSISFVLLTMLKNRKFVVFFIIAAVAVLFYYELPLQVDSERMFSNIEGGNGRTDIWMNFYEIMKSQGFMRVLLGCGTSGLTTLTLRGTYAHSAILDYFFSFGILGLIFIIYLFFTITAALVKAKNWYYMGLLILTFFMFFPHGVHSDFQFLLSLGLCMGATCLPYQDTVLLYTKTN